MSIFAEFAPLYWGAGIPAMPLKKLSKAPMLNDWTSYGSVPPTEAVKQHWLESYPDNNIGLPFGPASGLFAIDIDTVDEEIVNIIMNTLPGSPWTRVGKKGCGLIFRGSTKNFKIGTSVGMLIEGLGKGNQLVLPPSIHPDTMQPYTSNTNLWEVMDEIQTLPGDIEEQLRVKLDPYLESKGLTLARPGRSAPTFVVGNGERDIQLVKHAGYLARVVLGIDRSAKFTLADAMEQMAHWVTEYTAGASGDDMDPQKGVAKLLEFLLRDIEGGKTIPDGWDVGLSSEQLAHPIIVSLVAGQAEQKWTLSRAKSVFEDRLTEHPADGDWAQDCAKDTIRRVSSDSQFTDFEFDAVGLYLKKRLHELGAPMTKPALTKLFKEHQRGDVANLADHHAACVFMVEYIMATGLPRHCNGHFSQWTGTHFARLSDGYVCNLIGKVMKGNPYVRRHNDYVSVMKGMQNYLQEQVIEVPHTGINFNNGFLDPTGHLHAHAPSFGQTYTHPFDYEPGQNLLPQRLLEALHGAWGRDADYADKVAAIQEVFGATMFGAATSYQRAVLFYGTSGSSKSVIQQVLVGLLPSEAVTSLSPSVWGERFQTAQLVDVALNVCAELPELGKINGAVFKAVVDGSIQNAEFKGKTGVPFRPRAAHVFASNHLPTTRDTSAGFTRRWLFLRFGRSVPVDQRIPDYHNVILEEREAIAVWAVQGYLRLKTNGRYTLPTSHLELSDKVLISNNSVAAFLQNSTLITTTAQTGHCDAHEIFMSYKTFMQTTSSGSAGSIEQFIEKMQDLGHEISQVRDLAGNAIQMVSGIDIKRFRDSSGLRLMG